MVSGVYKITNTVNGKCYVGQSQDIARRRRTHLNEMRNGIHTNQMLQSSFRKYGEAAFIFEVLKLVPDISNLDYWEQYYMDTLKPAYNMSLTAGLASFRGKNHTQESRDKIAAARVGRKHTPEARARMSASHKGQKSTPEARAKMSVSRKGKKMSKERAEKHAAVMRSPETRAKISTANKGRKKSSESSKKTAAFHRGRKRSPETCAKISAASRVRFTKDCDGQLPLFT